MANVVVPLLQIGTQTFEYNTHLDLTEAKAVYTPRSTESPPWPNMPPFVVLGCLPGEKRVAYVSVLPQVKKFRYDGAGQVVGIPWKLVLKLATLTMDDHGARFFEHLTVGTQKKKLRQGSLPPAQKRRKVSESFASVVAKASTFTCTGTQHRVVCGTSNTMLSEFLDEITYTNTGKTVCTKCARNAYAWSNDGYLNRKHAEALLNALPSSPAYTDIVLALRLLFASSKDSLAFYTCVNPLKVADAFTVANKLDGFAFTLSTLLEDWLDASALFDDPQLLASHLDLTKAEFSLAVEAIACYQLFGSVKLQGQSTPFKARLANLLPARTYTLNVSRLELVVVPVLDPFCVVDLFQSDSRRVECYLHVYKHAKDRLDIPGVISIPLHDLSTHLQRHKNATVVAWPAHSFTAAQLTTLINDPTFSFILAGIPYVVADTPSYGQVFTCLLEQEFPFTSLVPSSLKQLQEHVSPPKAKIPPSVFPGKKLINLSCPVYQHAGQDFYYRYTLSTLLHRHAPFENHKYGLVPGPLIAKTPLDKVLQSRNICALQPCVQILQ